MPETYLIDIGITKNYYVIDVGFKIDNLLNEDYQSPHGFSQNGINFGLIVKSKLM